MKQLNIETRENLLKASKEELVNIIEKMNKGLNDMRESNVGLIHENLYFKKENDKLENSLDEACGELVKAYKKASKSPAEKWLNPENWKKKYMTK